MIHDRVGRLPISITNLSARLALLCLLWLIAIGTGVFGTPDTDLRLRMSHAWWTHSEEVSRTLPKPTSREDIESGVIGVGAKRYIFYDPGQSLLMLPADWFASKLTRWIPPANDKAFRTAFVSWLIFVPLNLALVLAGFWLLRLFGFEERLAALTIIVWLLGTTVLPYAQVAFQNNQVLLFVIAAHAFVLAWVRNHRQGWVALSGAAAAAALLMRATSAIHVFTIGLFLLACIALAKQRPRQAVEVLGCWLAGFLPLALAGRIFDYARYGSWLTTGQSVWLKQVNTDPIFSGLPSLPEHFPLVNDAHVGILGVLFSPAKSIFLYDPLLLPCMIVGGLAWKTLSPHLRCYVVLAILNLVMHIALTSRFDFWHGDWAWAARYHITSVDMLLVALLPSVIRYALQAPSSVAWLLRAAILLGIGVQMLAISMPAGTEIAAEVLRQPRYCEEMWNTPLEFRLGSRVRDLYCLATHAQSAQCPSVIAAQAQNDTPSACIDTVSTLKQKNRLAFFLFDSPQPSAAALALWGVTLMLAIGWTGIWFYSACRSPAHKRRSELQTV